MQQRVPCKQLSSWQYSVLLLSLIFDHVLNSLLGSPLLVFKYCMFIF